MPKVLLADDSTHAQRMGTKILTAEGIEVVTVSNGEAAVKKLDGGFDVVLADVFMPGRSGYELCSFIKTSQKYGHIPVVLVVGQLEPYDPDQGKEAGADAVLKKPFEASIVSETVKQMLELAKGRKPAPAAAKVDAPAAAPAAEIHEVEQLQKTSQTPRMEVPAEMQHAAAFDLFESSLSQPPPPISAAPEAVVPPAEPAPPPQPQGVERDPLLVDASDWQAAMPPTPPTPPPSAAPVEPPSSASAEAESEFAVPELSVSEDVSIPPEVSHSPRRWVAEPEAVTDTDRAAFAAALTAAASTVAVAAAAPSAPPVTASEPASVPDWSELLRSVEAPPGGAGVSPAIPAPMPEPEAAPSVTVELDPVPELPPAIEAEPSALEVSEVKETKVEAAADASQQLAAAVAQAAAAASGADDESARDSIRSAVEASLEKAFPGMKPLPSLIDSITEEIVKRKKP